MANQKIQPFLVVAGVAEKRGQYLLMRRKADLDRGGEWEFPGGKVARGESLDDALKREIHEELGVFCKVGEPIAVGQFPEGKMIAFAIEFQEEPLKSKDHDEFRWVNGDEILNLPLSFADYEIAVELGRQSRSTKPKSIDRNSNRIEFRRVRVLSVVRFFAVIYLVFGLLTASVAYFLQGFLLWPQLEPFRPLWGSYFLIPILYVLAGIGLGLAIGWIYNLIALLSGGIEVETKSS